MTLKDVIRDAVAKLGIGGSVNIDATTYTATEQSIIDKLVRCANMIYAEIATNYLPVILTERVTITAESFDYSGLTKAVLFVQSVKERGASRRFKMYASHLETTFSGEADITYAAVPDTLTLASELPDSRLPNWLFAEGVASEYCFSENLTEQSAAFYRSFTEGISRIKLKNYCGYVKSRRWYL